MMRVNRRWILSLSLEMRFSLELTEKTDSWNTKKTDLFFHRNSYYNFLAVYIFSFILIPIWLSKYIRYTRNGSFKRAHGRSNDGFILFLFGVLCVIAENHTIVVVQSKIVTIEAYLYVISSFVSHLYSYKHSTCGDNVVIDLSKTNVTSICIRTDFLITRNQYHRKYGKLNESQWWVILIWLSKFINKQLIYKTTNADYSIQFMTHRRFHIWLI